jgi:hypothetical protein
MEALKEVAHVVLAVAVYGAAFYMIFIEAPEKKPPQAYRRERLAWNAQNRRVNAPTLQTATAVKPGGPPAFVADVTSTLVNLGYAKKLSRGVALCAAGDDFESRLKRSLALFKDIDGG